MPEMFDILPHVKKAVNRLRRWLKNFVEKPPHITSAEWWSYARETAIMLVEGQCRCGRANCCSQHDLAQWDPQERSLESFIYRAIIGRAGLQPNSIAQGMLYPLLREDYGLIVAKVAFKQCAREPCMQEHRRYEGSTCPYCGQGFEPSITLVKAIDWLVIQGVYVAGPRWWACGTGRQAHYYDQDHCHESLVDNPDTYPEPSYHVQHDASVHDGCPVTHCPAYGQQHGLRGTTLWQRAAFGAAAPPAAASLPPFVRSVVETMRELVTAMHGWQAVWVLFLARVDTQTPPSAALWEAVVAEGTTLTEAGLYTLAEHLFFDREKRKRLHAAALRQLTAHADTITRELRLSEELRFPTMAEVKRFETEELQPQAATRIRRAFAQRGIHEDELRRWLRGDTDQYITGTEEHDDDPHA